MRARRGAARLAANGDRGDEVERLGDDRARVRATVTHHFSDRKYVSVEDDVIYLQRVGGSWLLAKPSATFYRAVGYAQPPLRAFAPPPGW